MNIIIKRATEEFVKANNRALDYLIASWNEKDKYDKAIAYLNYKKWSDISFKRAAELIKIAEKFYENT